MLHSTDSLPSVSSSLPKGSVDFKDNVSQLSQPNSETSTQSEINIEKYHRLATEFAKVDFHFLILICLINLMISFFAASVTIYDT